MMTFTFKRKVESTVKKDLMVNYFWSHDNWWSTNLLLFQVGSPTGTCHPGPIWPKMVDYKIYYWHNALWTLRFKYNFVEVIDSYRWCIGKRGVVNLYYPNRYQLSEGLRLLKTGSRFIHFLGSRPAIGRREKVNSHNYIAFVTFRKNWFKNHSKKFLYFMSTLSVFSL